MKHILKSTILIASLIVLVISCSKVDNQSAQLHSAPKYYDAETLTKYSELTNAGYALLDEGDADSAIASFQAAGRLIPEAKTVEYNIACVYGRDGNKDKAFDWMQKMADKGWDIPAQLSQDSDFASLIDDPRFGKIVEQCEQNRDANQATLGVRMPEIEKAPAIFTTDEELDEWAKEEYSNLRKHGSIWFESQYMKAVIDYRSRKLACLRELKKDDSEFDYALARVKEVSKIKSPYDCWGTVSQAVAKECDAYLAGTPTDEGSAIANFYAGLAYSLENCDVDDVSRNTLLTKSNSYLANIKDGAELFGPAQTLQLANKLDLAGDNKEPLKEEVRSILATYSGNWVNRIVSTRFKDDAIKMLWPIELGLNDLDNKAVKLDDYKGKVLLIDFWATWCGPCLQELPNVKNAYAEYHAKGFEIVSISLDYEDRKPLDAYKEWIAENEMTWRHIYDGKGWGAELVSKYFVSGIPAAFIIGKDGQIFAQGEDCSGPNLAKTIESALAL